MAVVIDAQSVALKGAARVPTSATSTITDHNLVNHVKTLFYRARSYRRPLVQQWFKNYEVLRNRTWGERAPWMPKPEVPEIFPIISALVGWETDQRPTFQVTPSAQPFTPHYGFYDTLAQDLETTMQAVAQVEDYDTEIERVLWDAKVYGTGVFKSVWDQSKDAGLGNACLTRVDPFTFYPDPDARSLADATYLIEVQTVSAQELERRVPGALAKLAMSGYTEDHDESPTVLSDSTRSGVFPKANPGAIPPATSPRFGLPGQTDRLEVTDDPGITVFEAWLRVPVEVEGDKDTMYDSWRVVIVAGNIVLMDEPAEELWSHGQHPYDRYVPIDTGEFWGYSMVEMLAPSQLSINRLLAAIEHNIWLIGNPVFKEDTRAGIQRTRLTNKPGQRVTINTGGTAEWLVPPQMHPQMSADLIRFYIGEMERISGLSAIVRGATPTGRNAQGVLDSVQEAAFVRIRQSLRSLERTLRSAGNKLASLIVEFYDTPRIVAIVGPSGERTSLALHSQHFYLPSDKGRTPMKFQLLVNAGSANAISRAARAGEADQLFAMGAIDEEAVLEAHDWPNRHLIVQRVREMKAQQGTLGLPPGARQRAGRSS